MSQLHLFFQDTQGIIKFMISQDHGIITDIVVSLYVWFCLEKI